MALQPGQVRIGEPDQLCDALSRSHLGDGRAVGWYGEPGWVMDAELDGRVPDALAARFGAEGFWARWTLAECAAKLAGVPIARWTRRHGLTAGPLADEPGWRAHTTRAGGLVLTVATLGRSAG